MIRNVRVPRGVARMGSQPIALPMPLVQHGSGGSAGVYTFTNGLSDDPRLAPYLQYLTPSQLQDALNDKAPSGDDMGLNDYGHMASCSNPDEYDPAICGQSFDPFAGLGAAALFQKVPTWGWIAGGTVAAILLLRR